jgi:hypothetical protein
MVSIKEKNTLKGVMVDDQVMLSTTQVRNWVNHGGGWCPFCQSEQIRYVSTLRAINSLTTVKYFCQVCQRSHFAIYRGDDLIDVTHDEISFVTD